MAVTVLLGWVRAVPKQEAHDLVLSLCGCLVQRSELPEVGHIDRGTVLDEELCHLIVAVGAGIVEGHQAALVLGVHVGRLREEELDDADPVVAGSKVERGGVSPVEVAAVDDVGVVGDDLLDELQVARLGRLQQLVLDVGAGGRGAAAGAARRRLLGEQLGDGVGGGQLRRRVALQADDGGVGAEVEENPVMMNDFTRPVIVGFLIY